MDHHWKDSTFATCGETVDVWDERRTEPVRCVRRAGTFVPAACGVWDVRSRSVAVLTSATSGVTLSSGAGVPGSGHFPFRATRCFVPDGGFIRDGVERGRGGPKTFNV